MCYHGSEMESLKELGQRTLIMGILNVTPDSFSDGGLYFDRERAIAHGLELVEEGADIIDVGGESTRPGAAPVPTKEELCRVIPVIEFLRKETDVVISIDTYKANVAAAALAAGAGMVNDISALRFDGEMIDVLIRYDVPIVLMHMQGRPQTMQESPQYNDVVLDIIEFLRERIAAAAAAGISKKRLIIDPGIGFGKLLKHNLEILRRLDEFKDLGRPILIGPSRKSFIGQLTGAPLKERLPGTIASIVLGIIKGAEIVRVHDVREAQQAIQVADAIIRGDLR